MSGTKELLDFQRLEDKFRACKTPEGNILVDEYTEAFLDLARFFELLGTAFSFVAKDIRADVNILRAHRTAKPDEYATLQSALAHETSATNGRSVPLIRVEASGGGKTKVQTKKSESGLAPGTVSAVHLRRCLDFVARFISRLAALPPEGRTGDAAADEYRAALARYDPWPVQKLAVLATKTLPYKGPFMDRYVAQTEAELRDMEPRTVGVMRDVLDVTKRLFEASDLLELP